MEHALEPVPQAPDESLTRAKKCRFCLKDRQKCERRAGKAKCERCLELSYPCDESDASSPQKRRKLAYKKCTYCRSAKQKCLPEDRVWPTKCTRCSAKGLECSPSSEIRTGPDAHANKKIRPNDASSEQMRPSPIADDAVRIAPAPTLTASTQQAGNAGHLSDGNLHQNGRNQNGNFPYKSTQSDHISQSRSAEFHPLSRMTPEFSAQLLRDRSRTLDSMYPGPELGHLPVYEYEPLKQRRTIRLLQLLPACHSETVECRITTMNEGDKYEALSYAWGSEAPTASIVEHQKTGKSKIAIKPNLELALRSLRYSDEVRNLWVDALCINQDDLEERSCQILMMAKIFNGATRVCVWLGDENEQSRRAIAFMKSLLDLETLDERLKDPAVISGLSAVQDLTKRPWFHRKWVMQEIVLARTAVLYCGQDWITWSDVWDVLSMLQSEASRIKDILRRHVNFFAPETALEFAYQGAVRFLEISRVLVRRTEDGRIAERQLSLENLVCQLSALDCSDPRDSIFACLGMAADVLPVVELKHDRNPAICYRTPVSPDNIECFEDGTARPALVPTELGVKYKGIIARVLNRWKRRVSMKKFPVDYRKSVFDVFQAFVSFAIRKSRSLDIICRPWAPVAQETLPSWIRSSWESPFRYGTNGVYYRANGDSFAGRGLDDDRRKYQAAGSTVAHKYKLEGGKLFVQGFEVDVVGRKGDVAREGIVPTEWMSLAGWHDTSSEDPPENLCRVLVGDQGRVYGCPSRSYSRALQYLRNRYGHTGALNTTKILDSQNLPSVVEEFLTRLQAVVWMRRLLVTQHRSMLSMGPKNAKKQDVVCILYGCSVPVLLRRRQAPENPSQSYHEFIGECYVHGIMDGEALDFDPGPNSLQTFELR